MPVYVYEVVGDDGQPGERFEIRQRMSEAALTHHPRTGQPVRRVIMPAYVAGSHSQMVIGNKLKDPQKLEQLGFTKYEKQKDGTYMKTAGSGPDLIKKPKPGSQ